LPSCSMTTRSGLEAKLAAMPPERRELARRLLAQRGVDVSFGPTRGPDDGTSLGEVVLYPEPGEWAAHHTAVEVELDSRVEPELLAASVKHVAERHGLAFAEAVDVTGAPFSADGPLLRASMAPTSLVLCGHDLAVDRLSLRLFVREVLARYTGGRSAALPVRFADVRRWRAQTLADGGFDEQLAHWRKALKPVPSRSATGGSKVGHRIDVPLAKADLATVARFAQDHGCSVLAVWTAVWSSTLRADEPFAIGCCLTGRNHESTQDVIGPMANPVLLPFDLRDSPSFLDLVGRARSVIADAVPNSDVPVNVVLANAAPHLTEDDVRSVTIGHMEDEEESFTAGPVRATVRDVYLGYAKEALRLEITPDRARIEFRPSRHSEPSVAELADRVATNLQLAVCRADRTRM